MNNLTVGSKVTLCGYSDAKVATVTRVSPSAKIAWVQEDTQTLLNPPNSKESDALSFTPGGFFGHVSGTQRWLIVPNPQGTLHRISLGKSGEWKSALSGARALLNVASPHYDFNF